MSDDQAVEAPPEQVAGASRPAGRTVAPAPRRRGPGLFTVVVLPALLTLSAVAGFLALTGGLPGDEDTGVTSQDDAAGGVNATYGPWLRTSAGACPVVTPSLLAAQIDQLTGFSDETAASGEQGIAAFTAAAWRTWGRDDDGNGRSSPHDPADAIMALGRQDCSLARRLTELRTDGKVNGDLADLTLAAYAVGADAVADAGKVPAAARTYLDEVTSRLAVYADFDREDPSGGAPAPANTILAAPTTTLTVTSPYGSRTHPLTGVTKLHTGVDFGAPRGARASAARDGRVVFAAMTKAYGNRVVVDHGLIDGKRLETTYSHLSLLQVTAGQTVRTGDPVGQVGSTGLSTGPHLHFEVIYDGYYTDPLPWLTPTA
ncbi:M23 family metallopeptidase [Streptomyces sp. NBC_00704]|uniref:M23 family metallopeptidase n=1 Tax=Streptomyces sp. NBC_00704 TaxID=2975809 RepID=UPI002E32D69F|nr:M23 family metallopeptidase [Streptomyces sp. NBC_00704]